ncbi:copper resistance CopC family protein [Cryobacterium sp. Y82]|uniref:copper resistance CopC family protein n=1 Tax=Cryobacterium sp. Y82 TaxID=2045017 RepID=UPI000CE42A88|nr:copper resistance CopC family protein [Cryobacterium sp. Y82]
MKFTTPIGTATALAANAPVASRRSSTVRANTATHGAIAPLVRTARQRPTCQLTASATRRTARALFAVVVAAAALGWGAAPAFAHNNVVGSSPAADSVVTEQPGVFSVTTSDLLLDLGGTGSGGAMIVTGPTSAPLFYGDGCGSVSGATVETSAQLGAAGEYTVIWQTISTDGHAISDEFTFDWQPNADQVLADGAATAPACATETDAATTDSGTSPSADSGSNGTLSTVAWIGGSLGAVLLAVGATLFALRRKSRA